MGSYKMLSCFNRKFEIGEAELQIEPPEDVRAAFNDYSENGNYMTAGLLHRFLVEDQGEVNATIADAECIIQKVIQQRHHITKYAGHMFTLDDFFHFIFSDDLNAPIKNEVHQDMTAPLSHYFIYTGHNSYLTGNQLSSDCSDIPIMKALKRGVRVIELDMWPNSSKDDVHVLHGRTLTSPVSLIQCLRSIKEHAFSASPYPVIITLEDHLTPDLQDKVAEMVTQTFGELLFYPESECVVGFPSPEALKYRIILSTKRPESRSFQDKESNSQKVKHMPDEDLVGKMGSDLMAEPESTDYKSDSDPQDDEDMDECYRYARQFGAPQYKSLITIPSGKPKGSLKLALKVERDKVRRLSLSEQAFEKATVSLGTEVVRFTQANILRVYPKVTRVTSSNYNPLMGWMHGAQMVAFNMQGYGKSLWLMHGMFRSNGGCGYVKKPGFLMNVGPHIDIFYPKATLPVNKTLKVRVYLGNGWCLDFSQTHFSASSPPDIYTRVGIAGVPADSKMEKTKAIEDNWNPAWEEEFTFPLTVPELALLRIEVHWSMKFRDDFGGQTCLPVSELRPGIRAVPLFDRKGNLSFAFAETSKGLLMA
ncbi:phosphoinositide phospholipase C 6-like isoform X3 [Macadamia integrifolia]|uniref:phosphoinositide phospholipase C 6-like isoform X3 n=1 Tax=Macadamia integrifolia TaxID=60698 RepID=UPI001C4E4180|nr:phosphoinositide phospholipase C 6-like isoform X3 [Macadamia integrifolia]